MDIFKFINPTNAMKMEQGTIINGIKSKMWIERYDVAGEFTLKGPASSRLREQLPVGTFISHTNTPEIMVVENHEINTTEGSEDEVTITGRGLETIFENRIVGSNVAFPVTGGPLPQYQGTSLYVFDFVKSMLEDHLYTYNLLDDDNSLPFITVYWDLASLLPATFDPIVRVIDRGKDLYTAMIETLAIEYIGVKVARPIPGYSPLPIGDPNTAIILHKGVDRTDTVIFSHDLGEIINADYFWSNQTLKNYAVVSSNWASVTVGTGDSEYYRRVLYVDASDVDQQYSSLPTDPQIADIMTILYQRGQEALLLQNGVALTKAEVSMEKNVLKYRIDFNVGDLITVVGDYNEEAPMRITEYVEIEDETGEHSYPTLALDIGA